MKKIYVTHGELAALQELNGAWDGISTVEGLHRYFAILGPYRTQTIIDAACAHEQVNVFVFPSPFAPWPLQLSFEKERAG